MNFRDSVRTCLHKYFTFSGRASRSEYWWFFLFCAVIEFVGNSFFSETGIPQLISLLLFFPSLAAVVRRLHDTNRSGFWILLIFVPVIGWVILFIFLVLPSQPAPPNDPHQNVGIITDHVETRSDKDNPSPVNKPS